MSKITGVVYKNFECAICDPATWQLHEKNFDCNHFDRCILRCRLCKQIDYDINNYTLWMNNHIPHTNAAKCFNKNL